MLCLKKIKAFFTILKFLVPTVDFRQFFNFQDLKWYSPSHVGASYTCRDYNRFQIVYHMPPPGHRRIPMVRYLPCRLCRNNTSCEDAPLFSFCSFLPDTLTHTAELHLSHQSHVLCAVVQDLTILALYALVCQQGHLTLYISSA